MRSCGPVKLLLIFVLFTVSFEASSALTSSFFPNHFIHHRFLKDEIKMELQSQAEESTLDYMDSIQYLRLKMDEDQIPRDIKPVFYPMSGFDSGLPVLLAPDADIVAVCDRPFIKFDPSLGFSAPFVIEAKGQRYVPFDEIRYDEYPLVSRILGNLKVAHKNLRVDSIDVYRTPQDQSIHGEIRFDSGEGTSIRRYIHIQEFMDKEQLKRGIFSYGEGGPRYWRLRDQLQRSLLHLRKETRSFWRAALDESPPDLVIIKGTHGHFEPQAILGTSLNQLLPSFLDNWKSMQTRKDIVQWLKRSRGILLAGGDANGQWNEFAGHSFIRPTCPDFIYHLPGGFGYGGSVYVHSF